MGGGGGVYHDTMWIIPCCVFWCVSRDPATKSFTQYGHQACCLLPLPMICCMYATSECQTMMWYVWHIIPTAFPTFVRRPIWSKTPLRTSNAHLNPFWPRQRNQNFLWRISSKMVRINIKFKFKTVNPYEIPKCYENFKMEVDRLVKSGVLT